jgi:hypothetical protein
MSYISRFKTSLGWLSPVFALASVSAPAQISPVEISAANDSLRDISKDLLASETFREFSGGEFWVESSAMEEFQKSLYIKTKVKMESSRWSGDQSVWFSRFGFLWNSKPSSGSVSYFQDTHFDTQAWKALKNIISEFRKSKSESGWHNTEIEEILNNIERTSSFDRLDFLLRSLKKEIVKDPLIDSGLRDFVGAIRIRRIRELENTNPRVKRFVTTGIRLEPEKALDVTDTERFKKILDIPFIHPQLDRWGFEMKKGGFSVGIRMTEQNQTGLLASIADSIETNLRGLAANDGQALASAQRYVEGYYQNLKKLFITEKP